MWLIDSLVCQSEPVHYMTLWWLYIWTATAFFEPIGSKFAFGWFHRHNQMRQFLEICLGVSVLQKWHFPLILFIFDIIFSILLRRTVISAANSLFCFTYKHYTLCWYGIVRHGFYPCIFIFGCMLLILVSCQFPFHDMMVMSISCFNCLDSIICWQLNVPGAVVHCF